MSLLVYCTALFIWACYKGINGNDMVIMVLSKVPFIKEGCVCLHVCFLEKRAYLYKEALFVCEAKRNIGIQQRNEIQYERVFQSL